MISTTFARSLILAVALTSLTSANAFAQLADPIGTTAPGNFSDETRSARSQGMGEAFTSIANGTGGIYQNPAGVARSVMYSVDGLFEYTPSGTILNASIVDSKTNPSLAAGAGYSYFFGRDELSHLTGHDIRLALGVPVVPDRVAIGVGGRYMIMTDSSGSKDDIFIKGFTLDAGLIFRLADMLHLGIAGKNLIDVCDKDARCHGLAPTTVTGGLSLGRETSFVLAADVGFDLTTRADPALNFGVGAEYLISGILPIRAGFKRDGATEHNFITFGGGWRSSAAGVDVSYQHDLQNSSKVGYIAGSFSLYF